MSANQKTDILELLVRPKLVRAGIATSLTLLLAVSSWGSRAAPLNLTDSPLFLASPIKPNIFFMIDDSGSMDWGLMTPENGGIVLLGGCEYYYTHPTPGLAGGAIAPAKNDYLYVIATEEALVANGVASPYGGVWRAWNKDYNALYYNPAVRYQPWQGQDNTGMPYGNSPPTAARYNPFRPGDGTINLTATTSYLTDYCPAGITNLTVSNFYPARYYEWTDSDSDGVVDASDTHKLVEIKDGTTYPKSTERTDCAAASNCTYAEEIQNFANWFSYYRKRDLTAKNAISTVVAPITDRVGYATLWNNSSANNIRIAEMNSSTASGNKKKLLDALFKTRPANSTPLRIGLDRVGKYYECARDNLFNVSGADCPILSETLGGNCQQNFTVLMTDGFYNDSFDFKGPIDNKDGDADTKYDSGPTGPYGDSYSNTLADIAMHYYERDLSGNSNNVRTVAGIDEATHQHMTTYTVAFGVNGTLTANPSDRTSPFAWPDPASGNPQKIDDLRHAAFNGRGLFLSARSPAKLTSALSDALSNIDSRARSAAAVAVNVRSLTTDTRIYQVRFNADRWSGDIYSLPLTTSGVIDTPEWEAAGKLATLVKSGGDTGWDSSRTIITRNDAISKGVPFRWTGASDDKRISTSQQAALEKNPATELNDGDGENRLHYLRGRNYYEINTTSAKNQFRKRFGDYLGDIVNSAAVYVSPPTPGLFPDSIEPGAKQNYSDFVTARAGRTSMLYVGANDGMFHGFEAINNSAGGNEKLAYVPSSVYGNLSKLTDPDYQHRYFVDGAPVAGNAYYGDAWHTLVVSGLGAGGKAYFGLDVTNPAAFNEDNAADIAKWEFSDATDPDMGFSIGQATIARMNNGRWAAIFGNGYNNAGSGRAVLYIVFLDGAADGVITFNTSPTATDFIKLDTQAGNSTTPNGLASPGILDANSDYLPDYIYAGDIRGNLWKFDVSSANPADWKIAYGSTTTPKPVFKTVDGAGESQPITVRPQIGRHPEGLTGYIVYFGTGKYIEVDDRIPTTTPRQSFYGIWDKNTNDDSIPVTRGDLLTQTISTSTAAGQTVRVVSNNPINWRPSSTTPDYLGWLIDLPDTGEMSVSNAVYLDSTRAAFPRVIFTTLIPKVEPCDYGGTSWLMQINPNNGGQIAITTFDVNEDGEFDGKDQSPLGQVAGINPDVGIVPEPVVIDDTLTKPGKKLKRIVLTGTSGATKALLTNDECNPALDPTCQPCNPALNPTCPPPGGGVQRKSWRQIK